MQLNSLLNSSFACDAATGSWTKRASWAPEAWFKKSVLLIAWALLMFKFETRFFRVLLTLFRGLPSCCFDLRIIERSLSFEFPVRFRAEANWSRPPVSSSTPDSLFSLYSCLKLSALRSTALSPLACNLLFEFIDGALLIVDIFLRNLDSPPPLFCCWLMVIYASLMRLLRSMSLISACLGFDMGESNFTFPWIFGS